MSKRLQVKLTRSASKRKEAALFCLCATTVKVIFSLSFTFTEPPPTFTGVMP